MCSAAASKSQLDWSFCSHVWRSVSRCQSRVSLQDMRYRNRRALSGRTESEGVVFGRQKLTNSRVSARFRRWMRVTHCRLVFRGLSRRVLKRQRHFQPGRCFKRWRKGRQQGTAYEKGRETGRNKTKLKLENIMLRTTFWRKLTKNVNKYLFKQ